ncbi:MAG: amidohydrolase family protein [Planctomycetota bacterium]
MAHPIAGPPIRDAVLLIEEGRLTAVGPADEVTIPADATVLEFPDSHAYPGLVDALSVAFGDPTVLNDKQADAGTPVFEGLDPTDRASRALIDYGITTAYVSNRADSTWRGLGAVLHPRHDGFAQAEGEETIAAGVQVNMAGATDKHPLERDKARRAIGELFATLEAYRKAQERHPRKVEKYEAEFSKYLDYHRDQKSKKGPKGDADKGEAKTGDKIKDADTDPPAAKPPQEEGGENGGGEGNGKAKTKAAPAKKRQTGRDDGAAKADGAKKKDADKAPKRPNFPKPPTPDPAKEALMRVVDGELPLRVEVQRAEEIQAALELAREHSVPRLVLEGTAAAADVEAIAAAGVPFVLTGFLEPQQPPRSAAFERAGRLAGQLEGAGVTVAIGSGSVRGSRHLPLLAAYAAGKGLSADAAVRAITLSDAEVLGVDDQVGSLQAGKRADVLIVSGPLLASDTRILAVLSAGDIAFRATAAGTEDR